MINKEEFLGLISEYDYRPMNIKELKNFYKLTGKDSEDFFVMLTELEEEGYVTTTKKGKYVKPEAIDMLAGKIDVNSKGFGFVKPINYDKKDIFIPYNNLNGALNKDNVLIKVTQRAKVDKRAEGKIIKILKRNSNKFIGIYEKGKNFGFVIPDDKKNGEDIYIPKSGKNGAKNNDKVVVEIKKWAEKGKKSEGRIIEILGNKDEHGVDILSIAKSFNVEDIFSKETLKEINDIPLELNEKDILGRYDFRDLNIITIDGDDAKDLDDAISIKKLNNGNYCLGVHIADVSNYVKDGTALNDDALERGTSVYLVNKVVPMLPKELSNGICSLNANVDRLTLSVIMEIDLNGDVVKSDIFKGVINVKERMTYSNVTKILVDEDETLIKRYNYILDDLKLMLELSKILADKRLKRGSIDFDFPELKVLVDEQDNPIKLSKYEITISNKIIEEFMLICNETIAEKMFWLEMPFMYRIHGKPDSEKLENLRIFLNNLGYKFHETKDIKPKEIQLLINNIKGKDEERIISTIILRSLQHAEYTEENQGHFGLAAKYYCHFTSPIRRYPDLFIHRVISELLENSYVFSEKRKNYFLNRAKKDSKLCSERERNAEEAERAVEDLMKVKYMKDKVGQDFEGIISSVTSFGYFVELDNLVEGLVHVDNMLDDYYEFDEKYFVLIGKRLKKTYKIGQKVKVRLVKSDIENRRIDFIELKNIGGEDYEKTNKT